MLPNLAFLVVLVVLVRLLLRVMRLVFDAIASGRVKLATFDAEWAEPTYKLLRLAVVAFALIVAYPYIPGSSSDAFKGVSLFVGLVFSLASTTVVANLLAGYALIYRRAFKVGDRIKTGDIVGVVTQSSLQSTHVRTSRNEDVIVPNRSSSPASSPTTARSPRSAASCSRSSSASATRRRGGRSRRCCCRRRSARPASRAPRRRT